VRENRPHESFRIVDARQRGEIRTLAVGEDVAREEDWAPKGKRCQGGWGESGRAVRPEAGATTRNLLLEAP
jgi:hypothetical protein